MGVFHLIRSRAELSSQTIKLNAIFFAGQLSLNDDDVFKKDLQ